VIITCEALEIEVLAVETDDAIESVAAAMANNLHKNVLYEGNGPPNEAMHNLCFRYCAIQRGRFGRLECTRHPECKKKGEQISNPTVIGEADQIRGTHLYNPNEREATRLYLTGYIPAVRCRKLWSWFLLNPPPQTSGCFLLFRG
jgi:hypothetical protein